MSVQEFPSEDSRSRNERAAQCEIQDVRVIEGDTFGAEATVYEIDVRNEDGELRENVTIVPSILFESTKDVQHRHGYGIVGKYSRALAAVNDDARAELKDAIRAQRESVQEEIRLLKEKDSRLLHTSHDIDSL